MSIKEEKKKVYVKPAITVAEWDFNEAMCQTTIYNCSNCIRVNEGGNKRVRLNVFEGDIEWKSTDETTNRLINQ